MIVMEISQAFLPVLQGPTMQQQENATATTKTVCPETMTAFAPATNCTSQ